MIKLAADLHIHSCLSPCASPDMTPNNIVNMAYLKGLQAISVCDHNCARNLPAVKAAADAHGLVFIPGIEVETREEVHVLTLFPSLEPAMEFGEWVYNSLPNIENSPSFFGEQLIMNEEDKVIGMETRLLLQSTTRSIDEVVSRCREFGGVPIPAHINRSANSLLHILGFIPPNLALTSIEVCAQFTLVGVEISRYHVLYDSDAHTLGSISEPNHFLSACEQSAKGILDHLAKQK